MSFKLQLNTDQGFEFKHKPGNYHPLRYSDSPNASSRLLGLFLAECWNRCPVQLIDTVIDHSKFSWDYWSLIYEDDAWHLRFHETALEIPDSSLRANLMELALDCVANLRLSEGDLYETDVLEQRALRLFQSLAAS